MVEAGQVGNSGELSLVQQLARILRHEGALHARLHVRAERERGGVDGPQLAAQSHRFYAWSLP